MIHHQSCEEYQIDTQIDAQTRGHANRFKDGGGKFEVSRKMGVEDRV